MRRLIAGTLGLTGILTGCELEEVTVPASQTIVIVQSVLRTDQTQQWILVERTFNGTTGGGVEEFLPGGTVPVPVEAAAVTVTNLSLPGDPCGPEVTFLESAGPPGSIQAGTYWAPPGCPTMRPGDTLELVVVASPARVIGRTTVPGTNAMQLASADDSVTLPGPALPFNRDVDTLRAAVDPITGRVFSIEIRERIFAETPEYISDASTQLWVDADTLTLPGEFLNVFDADFDEPGEVIPDLFNAGRLYTATLSYADDNFYDYLRSANSPLTGRGYINNLEGGFGLFASMTAARNEVRVVGNVDDAREGVYRMTGVVEGVPVTLDWELYLNKGSDSTDTPFSSYVAGDWVLGAYDAWTIGTFQGSDMTTFLVQPTGVITPEGTPELRQWELTGILSPTAQTTITVRGDSNAVVGTLTAVKQ